MRPERLIVFTATGTEMGKTWAAARLAEAARHLGLKVAARKPAQSFDPARPEPTDADVLARVTGEDRHAVCPPARWYPRALAPPMAAAVLGRPPFTIADLAAELQWPTDTDVGIVEGAGGVRSPLAHDGDTLALLDVVDPDLVVLVADPELGTINNVRLAVAALAGHDTIVFLNRYDPDNELHRLNHRWLTDNDQLLVTSDISGIAEAVSQWFGQGSGTAVRSCRG